jgi:CFEM domain
MLSTTLVLSTLGALASASSLPQLFARQNLNLTVVNVGSLGVPIDCLTTSQVISVSPACAQACQTLALQSDTACAFEDLTCQCAHNTAVGNVIGPCLALNSTCSPAVLTAFDNDFNAICAVRNATAASGKKPQCSSSSSSSKSSTAYTTSTVYSTQTKTITSCAPTVTNCPAHSTVVVTSVIAISTTICPVTQTWPAQTWSTPAAPASSKPGVWAPSSSPAAPVKASSSQAAGTWPTPSPSKGGAGYNQTGNGTWSTTGSGVTMFQGAAPKTAISSIAALAGVALAALML